jgi:hypothetical protein
MDTNRNVLKAVAAAVLASIAGLATAGGTTTVDVTATVSPVCTFNAATMGTIPLGTLNPSTVSGPVSNSGDITYNCTNGLTPLVSITGGGARTLTSGLNTIPYTFSLTAIPADAIGKGYGTPGSSKVVATATVTQAAVQAAQAGNYSEMVTLSIDN